MKSGRVAPVEYADLHVAERLLGVREDAGCQVAQLRPALIWQPGGQAWLVSQTLLPLPHPEERLRSQGDISTTLPSRDQTPDLECCVILARHETSVCYDRGSFEPYTQQSKVQARCAAEPFEYCIFQIHHRDDSWTHDILHLTGQGV